MCTHALATCVRHVLHPVCALCILIDMCTITLDFALDYSHCVWQVPHGFAQPSLDVQVFQGRALATYKLHLAAAHLPDQVRACGAGFFSTEFWVERLVQVLKRMIKYRSTAYPELLFVHDWLLILACRRVRRTEEGEALLSLDEALEEFRAAKRKPHDMPDADGTLLLGASKPVTAEEKAQVLPEYQWPSSPLDDVKADGLPLLLLEDPSLDKQGWPTFRAYPHEARLKWIYTELGLRGPMEEAPLLGEPPLRWVELKRFTRAMLPINEAISCIKCRTQTKKNNQWGLVVWDVDDGDGGVAGSEVCAVRFQYFVQANYRTKSGRDRASRGHGCIGVIPPKAESLKVAVAQVFKCQAIEVPGMRPLSEKSAEQLRQDVPEIVKLVDTRAVTENALYCGVWVLDLRTINSQLVPTKDRMGCRNFMSSNKASGRNVSVKR